jgi:phasin family protein
VQGKKDASMAKSTNPFGDLDLTKMMGQFKLPGFDMSALAESQSRNIEAVVAANRLAIEGIQAVARRQSEIMSQALERAMASTQEVMAESSPPARAAKQAEVMKEAFEKALANMRELAEMMTKSSEEALDVINRRFSASLEELQSAAKKTA